MNINHIRNQIKQHFKDKKEQYIKEKDKKRNQSWDKYYKCKEWTELRRIKFYNDPCCEACLKQGLVKPTDQVHHLHKFGNAPTEEAKFNLLLNYNNLASLCERHHKMAHEIMRNNHIDYSTIDMIVQYDNEQNEQLKLFDTI